MVNFKTTELSLLYLGEKFSILSHTLSNKCHRSLCGMFAKIKKIYQSDLHMAKMICYVTYIWHICTMGCHIKCVSYNGSWLEKDV